MISGIYKITNLINNNCYIGLSNDIERRWKRHISNANNENNKNALYRAFRRYGVENFKFEVLEEISDITILPIREKYWIGFYDSFNKGYNETIGGDGVVGLKGEKHPNHSVTIDDVKDIRTRWAAKKETVREIYIDYKDKIAKTGFKKIYSWATWKEILPELNTEENRNWHKYNGKSYANIGEKNGRSKISNDDLRNARMRYAKGESVKEIYKDYSYTGLTIGSFKNAIYCYNRKNI